MARWLACLFLSCMRARASVHQCRKWAAISFQTERMMVSQLLSLTSRVAYVCFITFCVSSVEALHCPKTYMHDPISLASFSSLGWKRQKSTLLQKFKCGGYERRGEGEREMCVCVQCRMGYGRCMRAARMGYGRCMRAEKKDRGWALNAGRVDAACTHVRSPSGRRTEGSVVSALGANAARPAASCCLPSIAAIEATAPAPIPQPGTLPASRSLDVMRPETPVLSLRRRPGRPHCCVCALLRCCCCP